MAWLKSLRLPAFDAREVLRCLERVFLLALMGVMVASCSGSRAKPHLSRPPIQGKFYRVHPGDTLYAIARRSGHDYHTLARWNHIRPPYTIKVGQLLRLVPPRSKLSSTRHSRPAVHRSSARFKKKSKKSLKILWRWPLKGVIARNFEQTGRKGIDIAATSVPLVRAAAAGKVVYSGSGLVGYGKLVIIKHGEIYLSAYGNNRRLLVREGQKVKAGQIISELAKGKTKRPVLHFEIRRQGDPVDPLNYLPRR